MSETGNGQNNHPVAESADPQSAIIRNQGPQSDGPLTAVRVLDFGRYIAGPYCAMLLADFGAEVIRIERREGGEDRYVAPIADSGEGPMFIGFNRNKMFEALGDCASAGQPMSRSFRSTS